MNMLRLSEEQVTFFRKHSIPHDEVFDASGMPTKVWKRKMKETGQRVAVGVTPCQTAGHEIRTRSGHCAACDTSQLAFSRRAYKRGLIYVLESRKSGLVKIGMTTDLYGRLNNLRSQSYGGADDWRIFGQSPVIDRAGRIEKKVQDVLSQYREKGRSSDRSGVDQPSHECFHCKPEIALGALKDVLNAKRRKVA